MARRCRMPYFPLPDPRIVFVLLHVALCVTTIWSCICDQQNHHAANDDHVHQIQQHITQEEVLRPALEQLSHLTEWRPSSSFYNDRFEGFSLRTQSNCLTNISMDTSPIENYITFTNHSSLTSDADCNNEHADKLGNDQSEIQHADNGHQQFPNNLTSNRAQVWIPCKRDAVVSVRNEENVTLPQLEVNCNVIMSETNDDPTGMNDYCDANLPADQKHAAQSADRETEHHIDAKDASKEREAQPIWKSNVKKIVSTQTDSAIGTYLSQPLNATDKELDAEMFTQIIQELINDVFIEIEGELNEAIVGAEQDEVTAEQELTIADTREPVKDSSLDAKSNTYKTV